MLVNQLHFDIISRILLVQVNYQRYLIGIVVQVDETIVQEETRVALFAVTVVYLLSSGDVVTSLNDEGASLIAVVPGGLPWSLVVEHVCVWHKAISLDSVNCNTKDSAGNHHSYFRVFFKGELSVVWNLFAN